jgi:hypothetical protein
MQTFNALRVHLHANFQPTSQNWTGTLNHQLCCANAAEVCRLTFRPDPNIAGELAALSPDVCTQTFNRPSKVCMQTFTLAAKVCMQTSNPPSQVCTHPPGSLHAIMQTFTALCGMSSKKHLKNQRVT